MSWATPRTIPGSFLSTDWQAGAGQPQRVIRVIAELLVVGAKAGIDGRRLAVQRLQAGQPMSAVARQMQASVSSVWRWWQTYQRAGPRGLRPTPTPGRP